MPVRVGINGFGSIGRRFYRIARKRPDIRVVAVNDLTDPATLAHLLKYDSNYGTLEEEVQVEGQEIVCGSDRIRVTAERDPAQLRWAEFGVEVVVESTGRFTEREKAELHITHGGAKKVIISAPAKGEDITVVLGVNEGSYDPARHHVISNASCTTNCLAPVAKVIHERFGIERGFMVTAHAYTNDQVTLDLPHRDLRRARAAAINIIPTTTGAAKAVALVLPELKGKLHGFALRVPVPTVSIINLVAQVSRKTTEEEVNQALREAARGPLKGILAVEDRPLVSSDYKGSSYSAVVDAPSTSVVDGSLVSVSAWYDNEWGYSERLCDLVAYLGRRGL